MTVHVYNQAGHAKAFDFGVLPAAEPMQRSLARLYAERSHRWTSHQSANQHWMALEDFTRFVAGQRSAARDLSGLTPTLLREWRELQMKTAGGRQNLQRVKGLLSEDARLASGPVADELARRVPMMASRTESYGEAEFDEIKRVARLEFRAALLRIEENAGLLEKWRSGELVEGRRDWRIGQILDVVARTGDVPRTPHSSGYPRVANSKLLGGEGAKATWGRLFLLREELVALGVLLMAEYGWNLSVIDRAKVPQAGPGQGHSGPITYTIPVEKRKRGGGRWFSEENVTDDGADSKGRLITQALAATRFARNMVAELAPGTDLLMVARSMRPHLAPSDTDRPPPAGPFIFGIPNHISYHWAKNRGLEGSPFRRGRRTVTVETRQPAQHSRQTSERKYVLPDPRTRREAAEKIAQGAEAALSQAIRVVAELTQEASPTHAQTPTADCVDSQAGRWPDAEGDCRAGFLLCLACPQARVHPGHHPRLAHLQAQLASLQLAPHGAKWREHLLRLEDLERKVGPVIWAQARGRVGAADRAVINSLLNGDFNP
ncbi:hypothetical protein ACFXKW_15675 [Streptomyces sp. NPDC059193]|uniref:hypothetical protein n=1 Tax=Streptomyces sp. NPDC059193 TaxID=3346763 RepID=UPI0036962973